MDSSIEGDTVGRQAFLEAFFQGRLLRVIVVLCRQVGKSMTLAPRRIRCTLPTLLCGS